MCIAKPMWAKSLLVFLTEYDPAETFYASKEEADAARPESVGSLVAPVLLVCIPEGKIVLHYGGVLAEGERGIREALEIVLAQGLDAHLVWELSYLL